MTISGCEFETERLQAAEWHALAKRLEPAVGLASLVAAMLTDAVTVRLPSRWQGPYTEERAAEWIAERDAEATVLLVVRKSDKAPMGLLVLNESEDVEQGGIEVRIGYLLAEAHWGRGFASELVEGFVGWCQDHPEVVSIAGGVERNNVASRRVLERNGFRLATEGSAATEDTFRLVVGEAGQVNG